MGYMGFGMRKEAYTRKPRVPFEKIKSILDAEWGLKGQNGKTVSRPFTKEMRNALRKKLQEQAKKRTIRRFIAFLISLAVTAVILLAIVRWGTFEQIPY